MLKEIGDQWVLPVWPYERFAEACAETGCDDNVSDAISLEQFVYHVLPTMIQQDICVEVLPTETKPGKLITAQDLFRVFEGMMESGEYFLEG